MEITASQDVAAAPITGRRSAVLAGLFVLALAVAGLAYYKWTGSARTVAAVAGSGTWTATADSLTTGGFLKATWSYFGRVWIALVFGILIGAAVRAAISPAWIGRLLSRGSGTRQCATGGLVGAPLMLCSCCVTPIFSSVYERGAPLGSSLSMMLASPGLNPAALVLTFLLFPLDLSLLRLAAALLAVLVLPGLLQRWFGSSLRVRKTPGASDDPGPANFRDYVARFGRSIAYLTVVTIPLIAAGVLLSSLILPMGLKAGTAGALLAVTIVGAAAVMVALPTFFEFPLAFLLLNLGSPGAAAAILFAGPIINLPSLFVLARETNVKVASALGVGIWVLAVAAGLVAAIA